MKLKTEREIQLIVNNINKVISTNNIEILSKQAYNFLYLSSGFIAHYNINGFKDHYADVDYLANTIIENEKFNTYDNFRVGDENYYYYRQKAQIYEMVVTSAKLAVEV